MNVIASYWKTDFKPILKFEVLISENIFVSLLLWGNILHFESLNGLHFVSNFVKQTNFHRFHWNCIIFNLKIPFFNVIYRNFTDCCKDFSSNWNLIQYMFMSYNWASPILNTQWTYDFYTIRYSYCFHTHLFGWRLACNWFYFRLPKRGKCFRT